MDGKCAAAIVRKKYGGQGEYFPVNYNFFPYDIINLNEEVIIVDYSLQGKSGFNQLKDITHNIIWIDHHKTAMNIPSGKNLNGVRSNDKSACELVWDFFFKDETTPSVVTFIGDYDTWKFRFGEETEKLMEGIQSFITVPTSENWNNWLDSKYFPYREIKAGGYISKYMKFKNIDIVTSYAFKTYLNGYSAIACNNVLGSSKLFDSIKEDYDLMIGFAYNGKSWSCSLYTEKENIDVSKIAKTFGGGGHKGAAGFSCDRLPFVRYG